MRKETLNISLKYVLSLFMLSGIVNCILTLNSTKGIFGKDNMFNKVCIDVALYDFKFRTGGVNSASAATLLLDLKRSVVF